VEASAVLSGVNDIRQIMESAEQRWISSKERTIVFLDEIHRFNKSQQDALLPFVERGTVTLIGATTENPSFEVNAALLSRARVLILERLSDEDIRQVVLRALSDPRGYGGQLVLVPEEVIDEIVRGADGDARRALNALESGVEASRDEGGAESPLTDSSP
jgi:putative ATPase